MNDRVRASLPGFASAAVFLVWGIGTLTGAFDPGTIGNWMIGLFSLIGGWLGIAFIPPRLPGQE